MEDTEDQIAQLQNRLDNLVRTQISFQQEVTRIADELKRLRGDVSRPVAPPTREYIPAPRTAPIADAPPEPPQPFQRPPQREVPPPDFGQNRSRRPPPNREHAAPVTAPAINSTIERFIGENLISKIGIIVMIIGVAIGAKYAIDNDLISPATRIALGYLFGLGLLGLALWLKAKYLNFSAVLLSGAVAILYFITFFAYNLYGLFPQPAAFGLMIVFTVFAVAAALFYNRQVIAHLGLVGAYAVPFLLSNNSGNYAGLFGYIAVINVGILAISVKRYWRALFYTTFVLTWLIFAGWFAGAYRPDQHFVLGFSFLALFFTIFYATFLVYKVASDENLAADNVTLVLSNSFIFFGFGLAMLSAEPRLEDKRGLFAVLNAAIHFVVALVVGRLKRFPRDVDYLLVVLIVTFATIAVPLQLEGNWILLVWTVEAAMLFALGRSKHLVIFEYLSYPLMALALFSLFVSWVSDSILHASGGALNRLPIANGMFASALLFVVAFGFIYYVNRESLDVADDREGLRATFGMIVAAVALAVLYNALRMEIADYFLRQIEVTAQLNGGDGRKIVNHAIGDISTVWQINFTLFYVSVLSFLNMNRWKNPAVAIANTALTFFSVGLFLTVGLYTLSEPRTQLSQFSVVEQFAAAPVGTGLRYLSFVFFGGLIATFYGMAKQDFAEAAIGRKNRDAIIDAFLYIPLFVIGSSEVINLGRVFGIADAEKFGLSIFWGVYALALIALGISLAKKHLRIGGFIIFGMALAKVFLYDIAGLGTIPKMIVFVVLGALLLGASFLYAKYKTLIFGDSGD